jgi:two-component system chemotaxis response regulator CheY
MRFWVTRERIFFYQTHKVSAASGCADVQPEARFWRKDMRILIVEDDFSSRKVLEKYVEGYGRYDVAVDGQEALASFKMAWKERDPYDLILLDIRMPNMDGQEAVRLIRDLEKKRGVQGRDETKVIAITALDDPKNVFHTYFKGGVDSYLVKPLDKEQLERELQGFGFLPQSSSATALAENLRAERQ